MTEYIPHQFEKLKTELLEVSGIKQIIPSDCKRLAANIYAKTHLQVSETTLKRVFGFACSEFRPSAFTISAIAQYCGYAGWNDFVDCFNRNNEKQTLNVNETWQEVRERAKKTTGFTLQTLQNRSGIPYQYTIGRDFVNQHLEIFSTESYSGTILSAPTGYGKTIALCHWVSERINNPKNEDIILYYKYNIPPGNVTANQLTAFLLTMLGSAAEGNLFETDFFENTQPKGKFYFIVDGLNDSEGKRNEFQSFFNQLVDVVSLYHKYPWFKVIVSMRSATWINNRHLLNHSAQHWFLGFMNGYQQAVNVPLLDAREIELLSNKINPLDKAAVKQTHIHNLSHPLYFQYYYQLHHQNFSLSKVNQSTVFDLTTAHVVRQVYRGKYNDDKVFLLRAMIANLEMIDTTFIIDKQNIADVLRDYQPAYRELLSTGYLRTANITDILTYDNYIEFGNPELLHFTIAETLIAENQGNFDDKLIGMMDRNPAIKANKLQVLKWCVYNIAITGQVASLNWLTKMNLSVANQAELILLLGQLLKNQKNSTVNKDLFAGLNADHLFNYITGAEFMDKEYEQSLLILLNFNLNDQQRLTVNIYLALIAVINLDIAKLEKCIADLKLLSPDSYKCMPVNPLHGLDAIYFYLKFGIVKKEALVEITRFYFNPSMPEGCDGNSNINNIIPMLAICTAMICRDDSKTVKFITALQKVYPAKSQSQSFLLKTWLASAYVSTDKTKALQLFRQLSVNFAEQERNYTAFMKISYYALKVKMACVSDIGEDLFIGLKSLIRLCDAENHKMIKVTTIAHLLSNDAFTGDPKLTTQFYYDLVKTTRSNSCRADSFFAKPINVNN